MLTKKYLKKALGNKEFYESLLDLDCLCYEISTTDGKHLEKYMPKSSNAEIIGSFGDLMQKQDFDMAAIYDVKELKYSKVDTLTAFCEEIKNTPDEKMKGVFENGLFLTCNFFEGIGQPLKGLDNNINNEMLSLFENVKTVEDASMIDKEKLLEIVKNRKPIDRDRYNKLRKQALDDFNAIAEKIGINKINEYK